MLAPFRAASTDALVIVQQGNAPLVDYKFTFEQTRYPLFVQRWSPDAEFGLEWAAYSLADEVVPAKTVTLTITATAENNKNDNLASASSPLTAETPGFFPTVVQSRIQTGSPSVINKDGQAVPDATVTVNFNKDWGYYGVVKKIYDAAGEITGQYDYDSVMMHEMMHAFGFISTLSQPGCNVYECNKNGEPTKTPNNNWSIFDKFITDSTGNTSAINPTTFAWNTNFESNLTGGNGGLYFTGTNEKAAFGDNPVPLFTPNKWRSGSSTTHLDDTYFNNTTQPTNPRYIQLMNADDTPGIVAPDYLSPIEIGILKDLGYTMAAAATASPL